MAQDNLAKKTTKNFIWNFAERCGAQGVAFIVSIVLARLLDPSVYGTIALVTVFTAIMSVFVDSGIGVALIQKKDVENVDFSSVFYLSMGICALLYVGMFFAAPFIGDYYGEPIMVPVLRVLTLSIIFAGIRNIQTAYLSRKMQFRKSFFSNFGGTLISAAVGIGMAYAGYGIWALVGQQLTNEIVSMIILWFAVKWRPTWEFSFSRVKSLFSYGWKILACNLLDTAYSSLRQLVIGKRYTGEDLAYYNKGEHFPRTMVYTIDQSIERILLPTMSQEQDNLDRIKAITRRRSGSVPIV